MKENTIANTLEFLDGKKLIMVALMAKLKCDTFWEKLLIPSFIYFFLKIYHYIHSPSYNILLQPF